jgi:hypothetical protein
LYDLHNAGFLIHKRDELILLDGMFEKLIWKKLNIMKRKEINNKKDKILIY